MQDVLPRERLDWAFAGTSSSVAPPGGKIENGLIAHAKWTHWVDSHCRHDPENGVSDEGDMYVMADGRTLEKGVMAHPVTGEVGAYEEVWRDVEIIATGEAGIQEVAKEDGKGKAKAKDLDSAGGGNSSSERKKRCIVLTLTDEKRDDIRGMAIRLGQFCQGVLRVGDYFAIERWIWHESGGWKREVSMGGHWVPCGVLTADGVKIPEAGGTVVFGDFTWTVAEKGEL